MQIISKMLILINCIHLETGRKYVLKQFNNMHVQMFIHLRVFLYVFFFHFYFRRSRNRHLILIQNRVHFSWILRIDYVPKWHFVIALRQLWHFLCPFFFSFFHCFQNYNELNAAMIQEFKLKFKIQNNQQNVSTENHNASNGKFNNKIQLIPNNGI